MEQNITQISLVLYDNANFVLLAEQKFFPYIADTKQLTSCLQDNNSYWNRESRVI